jgi:hypothetical protein
MVAGVKNFITDCLTGNRANVVRGALNVNLANQILAQYLAQIPPVSPGGFSPLCLVGPDGVFQVRPGVYQNNPTIWLSEIGTSSTQLLGYNLMRTGLVICPLHATQTLWFTDDTTAPVANQNGQYIAALDNYSYAGLPVPTNPIYALASGASTYVMIKEFC